MRIGLALGGRASRGIAHIAMLEAFDDLGIVVAVDVTGKPRSIGKRNPSNMEIAFGSMHIMFHELAERHRQIGPPEIHITPAVDNFGAMDFFMAREFWNRQSQPKTRCVLPIGNLKHTIHLQNVYK